MNIAMISQLLLLASTAAPEVGQCMLTSGDNLEDTSDQKRNDTESRNINSMKSRFRESDSTIQSTNDSDSSDQIKNTSIKVPQQLLMKIKDVKNAEEFLSRFVTKYRPKPPDGVYRAYLLKNDGDDKISEDELSDPDESDNVPVADYARCQLETHLVELNQSLDPSVIMWPTCTRIERCSGCCISELLECVPTKTSSIFVKVIKAIYSGPGVDMFDNYSYEIIRLERHEQCSCQCRERKKDCGSLQVYKADECRCICKNQHSAVHCKSPKRIWDHRECVCKCKIQEQCSTGYFFDSQTCSCRKPVPVPVGIASSFGPAPQLGGFYKDDGGENDGYRYRQVSTHNDHLNPFVMEQYADEPRTVQLVDKNEEGDEGNH